VSLLISVGADVKKCARAKGMRQPIHAAADKGHAGIVDMLVKAGADVNAADKSLNTPLLVAASEYKYETVEYILKNGGNINCVSCIGNIPTVPTSWLYPETYDFPAYRKLLGILIKYGADINKRERTADLTPLAFAVYAGDVETVKYLLERGADRSIPCRYADCKTVMELAKYKGFADIEKLLITYSASNAASPASIPAPHKQ
jgi:ankyrin repeat protein